MTDIAVKVRSTRYRESVFGRKLTVTIFGCAIVIAMANFERLQSGGGKAWDEMVHRGQTGMGHRHETARLTHDSQDRFGRWSAARHERRPARSKQPLERIITIARLSRAHERIGDLRPSNTATAAGSQLLAVDDIPERGQAIAYLSNPFQSLRTLRLEELSQRSAPRIDEVGKHVQVAAVLDGGNLDTANKPKPAPACGVICFPVSGARVVIGDTDRAQPRISRARDEHPRRQEPIGRSRMQVEVDQESASGCRRGRRLVTRRARRRRWRSSSDRYSRISSSRCARSSSANSRKIFLPSESSNLSP